MVTERQRGVSLPASEKRTWMLLVMLKMSMRSVGVQVGHGRERTSSHGGGQGGKANRESGSCKMWYALSRAADERVRRTSCGV